MLDVNLIMSKAISQRILDQMSKIRCMRRMRRMRSTLNNSGNTEGIGALGFHLELREADGQREEINEI